MAEVLLWVGFGALLVVGLGAPAAGAAAQLRAMERIIERRGRHG